MRRIMLGTLTVAVACWSCTTTATSGGEDAGQGGGASSSSSGLVRPSSSASVGTSSSRTTSSGSSSSSTDTRSSSSSTGLSSSSMGGSAASATSAAPSSSAGSSSAAVSSSGPVGCTALPDVDPWDMRPAAAGTGGVTVVNQGGYQDVYLDSPTLLTRIGVRLDWGGTVVFFGLRNNPASNVIDANDTGRELQLAIYDPDRVAQGCAYNASCASGPHPCAGSITYLGWNPVQGGDECNHGATSTHTALADGLEVVVHPLQWNPDWNAVDCRQSSCGAQGVPVDVTYVMRFRYLSEHVVHLALEVQSQETLDHAVTGQEFPTLYVSHGQGGPDLQQLLDAAGNAITIDQPANDGFFVRDFTSSRPWVTFQDSGRTYGVGLAMDQGIPAFQGWRGNGNTAPYFHNVRAHIAFGLTAMGLVRGAAYLALGNEATVRAELEAALGRRAPFGVVDQPAANSTTTVTAGQDVLVRGWALDGEPVATVEARVDGAVVGNLGWGAARPDVCVVYPAYAGCPNVGWQGMVSTTGLAAGCHVLSVVARDGAGNSQLLGERILQVQ